MENKEIQFNGFIMNGFVMLFVTLALMGLSGFCYYVGGTFCIYAFIPAVILTIVSILFLCGFMIVEPNEANAMVFFGVYRGTLSSTGYYWMNPFYSAKKVSLRARNLNVEPIKVNDKVGNPIMIGLVLVWRLKDTYRALFEIDSETMASKPNEWSGNKANRMKAFEAFVRIQSDAALRQVAGLYAYDNNEGGDDELTLRNGGDEVNEQLVDKLNERLAMAGIDVVEARINYLAYAPEIAAVMLRRQQASAIISAREKIVEGAVSMVKMALDKLAEDEIVELDEEKKAAMVSNLLVVLCADEQAQPVVNTGTLYQ